MPESTSNIQALGDASGILGVINIDRGASSLMVLDRAELPQLLDQFTFVSNSFLDGAQSSNTPAPANGVYQPSSLPWQSSTVPEFRECSEVTPSTADYVCVFVYPLDDPDSVGIWLYSDWN